MICFEELRSRTGHVATLAAHNLFHVTFIGANRVVFGVFRNTDTVYPVFSRPTHRNSVTNVSAVTASTTLWLYSQSGLIHDVGERIGHLQGLRGSIHGLYAC